jgi:hypothetical protein
MTIDECLQVCRQTENLRFLELCSVEHDHEQLVSLRWSR